jgi:adenylate cyclase
VAEKRYFGRERSGRRGLLVAAAGFAALAVVLGLSLVLGEQRQRLAYLIFDAFHRLHPREPTDPSVAVIDIDEASIARIGQWPWPRTIMADLVAELDTLGVAAIAFDIVFSEPDRTSLGRVLENLGPEAAALDVAGLPLDNDSVLAGAVAGAPVVMGMAITSENKAQLPLPKGGFSFGGSNPVDYLPAYSGGVTNLEILDDTAPGLGVFSFPPSSDNIIRSMPLVLSAQGRLYPGLSIEALRIAQGAGSFALRSSDASGEGGRGGAMTALRVGLLDAPVGPAGEFWVHYSGLPDMPVISAADVLAGTDRDSLAASLAGRIALVGTSAVGLRDIVATPVDAAMPGVNVHAEIIDQIVSQSFLMRPDWAPGLEIALAVTCGLALVALVSLGGPILSSLGLAGLSLAAIAGSWWAFASQGLLIDPLLPLLCMLAVFGLTAPLVIALANNDKLFVRNAFGRYLSPSLVERLSEDPAALRLGGEMRELTVLFSDIRGFTGLSETLEPTVLTTLLNQFLTPMTDVLLARDATIDKYIGDAIMAFWNAPLDIADHPRKACLAALDMLEAVEQLNAQTGRTLRVGIGLHTGWACVGNLGSEQRFSYSAIGDAINLASRVEGLTKQYGVSIAVTSETRHAAGNLAFLEIDAVRVLGRSSPVTLHALIGDSGVADGAGFAELAVWHGRLLDAYRSADFRGARTLLEGPRPSMAAQLAPVYALYADRMDAFIADPPETDWDGVHVAQSK